MMISYTESGLFSTDASCRLINQNSEQFSERKKGGDTIFSVVKEDWLPACYQFVCEDRVKVRLHHDSCHSRFA